MTKRDENRVFSCLSLFFNNMSDIKNTLLDSKMMMKHFVIYQIGGPIMKSTRITNTFKIWLKRTAAAILASMMLIAVAGCAEDDKARVDFMANGGTGTMAQILTDKDHTTVQLTANTFTRDGYKFTGWNTNEYGKGTAYADGQTVTLAINNSLILYAQWESTDTGAGAKAAPEVTATSQTATAEAASGLNDTPTPTPSAAVKASAPATATSQSATASHKVTWHDRITEPIYEERTKYAERPIYEDQPVYETQSVDQWEYSYSAMKYTFSVPLMDGQKTSEYIYDSQQDAISQGTSVAQEAARTYLNDHLNTPAFDSNNVKCKVDTVSNSGKWRYVLSDLTYTYPVSQKAVVSQPVYSSAEEAAATGKTAADAAGAAWYDEQLKTPNDPAYVPSSLEYTLETPKVSTETKVQVGMKKVEVDTEKVVVGTEKVIVGEKVIQEEGWY
jgi:uncharacterized repeat protein (TIGR02543 family)